ncbi:MAG: hypothetical protein P8O83_02205, partial [Flavobacteriaceae bacterium]|nr:hypothetical protein [Flavobacteriaceae bacterium]
MNYYEGAFKKEETIKDGSVRLYLEIHKVSVKTEDGKIKNLGSYEYLNLYLKDKPKTTREKQTNKETLELAELTEEDM